MRNITSEQGNIWPFPGHNTAFEVDADYLDGKGCPCLLCRPHSAMLSFVSRDNLGLTGGHPAHRFTRQRLNHQFTAIQETEASTGTLTVGAPRIDRLEYRRTAS